MKLLRSLFILFLLIPFAGAKAQDNPFSKAKVLPLLCKKWRVVQIAAGDRRMDMPPNNDYMLFNSDFSYETKENDHVEKGTFRYNDATRKLSFSTTSNQYIVKAISATELMLDFSTEGTPGTFILKPVK